MNGGLIALALSALALGGCERGLHEMYDQPRYGPLAPSPLFADGNSSRPQAPDTVPRSAGSVAGSSSGRNGLVPLEPPAAPAAVIGAGGRNLVTGGQAVASGYTNPLPVTPALLARGRERFDIYCAPCHSRAGDGDGMIVRRGFPAPPSYHSERLRAAPDSHFYEVISNGYGVMYPYADRIAPEDRWAIVAYIRALQLSRHAPRSSLSPADLAHLAESAR
ncbi:MAG: cytochrome c [Steroidobacteraceae bacterium]